MNTTAQHSDSADSLSGGAPSGPPTDDIAAREHANFERLAETWWDQSGPFWPLHRLNALRTSYLESMLRPERDAAATSERPLAGLRVLDVGCGGGILSESMARLGADVFGIDVVERSIRIASRHAERAGLDIRYECTTAEELVARGLRFDVVLNMEVVEHVADVSAFMDACAALVSANGTMVVATINRTLKAWLFAIVGAEYVLRWLPRGTHRWGQFVTPAEVTGHLQRHGLQVVDSTGVRVNPFTRGFSLQRSEAVNYMLVARRGAGA